MISSALATALRSTVLRMAATQARSSGFCRPVLQDGHVIELDLRGVVEPGRCAETRVRAISDGRGDHAVPP